MFRSTQCRDICLKAQHVFLPTGSLLAEKTFHKKDTEKEQRGGQWFPGGSWVGKLRGFKDAKLQHVVENILES